MSECSVYLPSLYPDKFLPSPGSPLDMPVQSANNPINFTWYVPSGFLTVNPELVIYWLNLGDESIKVDWLLKYTYYNSKSCLGYFDEELMPVITFDGGLSDVFASTLKMENVAEKDIIQKTLTHKLNKRDFRSGTIVSMEIQIAPPTDEVYVMGTQIGYEEHPLVRDPPGRKRTYKRSRLEDWSDASYYDSFPIEEGRNDQISEFTTNGEET